MSQKSDSWCYECGKEGEGAICKNCGKKLTDEVKRGRGEGMNCPACGAERLDSYCESCGYTGLYCEDCDSVACPECGEGERDK